MSAGDCGSMNGRAFLGALALMIGWSASGCESEAEKVIRAQTRELVVERGDIEDTVLMTGTLKAVESTVLVAPRPRRWAWLSVRFLEEDGARVSAGQVVLEFDNSEFVSRLEELELGELEAKNRLEQERANNAVLEADKDIERQVTENLLALAEINAELPANILPERDYQENQLELERTRVAVARALADLEAHRKAARLGESVEAIALETAEREIRSAEREIESFTLRAPKDGILIVQENLREDRKVKVGDTVFPGMPVLEIPNLDKMYVEARLSDVDDGRITVGMQVTCVLDAFSDRKFSGRIDDISPVAQSEEEASLRRSFDVRVSLDDTDAERMLPGMSVKVMVHANAAEDVLLAPRAGLDIAAGRAYLARGGTADVDIDWCSPRSCIIRSGLEAGERLRPGGDL